jgi:hypothetical protein
MDEQNQLHERGKQETFVYVTAGIEAVYACTLGVHCKG